MGVLKRAAEWGDLGQMLGITDQWGREYGLTIRSGEDGQPSMNFVRGIEGAVKNRHHLKSGDMVFFHSHPRQGTADGLYAPLISRGDMNASDGFDYGGAYLNIVCKSGITLQVDAAPASPDEAPGWIVESGELRGEVISPDGTGSAATTQVLEKLHELKQPFAYSINVNDPISPKKVMFIHIPWQHLDTTETSLQDVCFGTGLQKILPLLLPHNSIPPNLHSAIQKAKNIQESFVTSDS